MADANVITTYDNVVSNQHYRFEDIHKYIANNKYPDSMKDKGEKANFRRAAKAFAITNGKLTYLKNAKDGSQREVCKIKILILLYNLLFAKIK